MNHALTLSAMALYFRARPEERDIAHEFLRARRDIRGVNLTEGDVMEFKRIYEHTTGKHIDMDTAREKATKLITFVHVLISANKIVGD